MRQQFLVVGLGRFGANVAAALSRLGQDVLALDLDGRRCEELKTEVTHVAQGDATDVDVLSAIDVEQFDAGGGGGHRAELRGERADDAEPAAG